MDIENDDRGWIKVFRKLQNHWLWDDRPFSKGQAWLDLMMSANHKTRRVRMDNQLVTISRGTFITSTRKLADRWGWSRKKVISFLDLLENDKMLARKSDTKKTVLTLVNYGQYQVEGATKKPRKSHGGATVEPPVHTNKNVKNVKNEKKKTVGGADISPAELKGKNPDDMTEEEKVALRAWLLSGG